MLPLPTRSASDYIGEDSLSLIGRFCDRSVTNKARRVFLKLYRNRNAYGPHDWERSDQVVLCFNHHYALGVITFLAGRDP